MIPLALVRQIGGEVDALKPRAVVEVKPRDTAASSFEGQRRRPARLGERAGDRPGGVRGLPGHRMSVVVIVVMIVIVPTAIACHIKDELRLSSDRLILVLVVVLIL